MIVVSGPRSLALSSRFIDIFSLRNLVSKVNSCVNDSLLSGRRSKVADLEKSKNNQGFFTANDTEIY